MKKSPSAATGSNNPTGSNNQEAEEEDMVTAILRVPGASENRPLLRFGDTLRLRLASVHPSNSSSSPTMTDTAAGGGKGRGGVLEVEARVLSRREEFVTVRLPSPPELSHFNRGRGISSRQKHAANLYKQAWASALKGEAAAEAKAKAQEALKEKEKESMAKGAAAATRTSSK